MATEFETKILDINIDKIKDKLDKIGAKYIGKFFMKRWVFIMDSEGYNFEWLRLRDNGDGNITLTYKKKNSKAIGDTDEIEVRVDDFEQTYKIISKMKFKEINYQENKRTIYKYENIEYAIDTRPMIPSYLEIEASDKPTVIRGLELLEIGDTKHEDISIGEIFSKYNIDFNSFDIIKFEEEE